MQHITLACIQLTAKVFKLSFEYLHIYNPKSGKNSKIASLMSCQRSDLRKTLKYSQSWTLGLIFEYPTVKVRRRPWVADTRGPIRQCPSCQSGLCIHCSQLILRKISKIAWCHQMSDFKAKMHQIRFPLGLRPRPFWGSLQRSPRPLAVLKEAYF